MPVYSYVYSIPYFIFLFYLFTLMFLEFRNINEGKDIKLIKWATMIGFMFFLGLRGFIFTDWMVYYPMFDKMPTIWDGLNAFGTDFSDIYGTDESIGRTGTELGFIYYTMIFKSFIPDFQAWIFFSTLIDYILLHFFIKRFSPYYVLAFICFYIFEGLGIEANLMRNIKSILLFLISLKYIEERKPIPYYLLNIAGIFFHSTSIIYLPLYFVLHKVWSKKVLWILFTIGILILLFQVSYIAPILSIVGEKIGGRIGLMIHYYLISDLYSSSFGLFHFGYLERAFTFCLMIGLYDKIVKQSKSNILFLNSFVIYFVIFFYFSEITVIIERLPLLFVFSYWILYPTIFSLIFTKINKALFFCILLFFVSAKFLKSNNNILVKYDNVLLGYDNYELRHERFINHINEIEDKQ
jgi:hypothetical protein